MRLGRASASGRSRTWPSRRVSARSAWMFAGSSAVPDRLTVASTDAARSLMYSSARPAIRASVATSERVRANRPSNGHGAPRVTRPLTLAPSLAALAATRATPPVAATRALMPLNGSSRALVPSGPPIRNAAEPTSSDTTPSGRVTGPEMSASKERPSRRPTSLEPVLSGAMIVIARSRPLMVAVSDRSSSPHVPEALNVPSCCVAFRSLTERRPATNDRSPDTEESSSPFTPMPGPET